MARTVADERYFTRTFACFPMRLVLILSALAASAQPTHSHGALRALATTYPACTTSATKLFIDNISAASSGCMDSISYDWDGSADPTPSQTTELCKCSVSPFSVPKCHWTKLGQYDVTTAEHFNFAYNCSGKPAPKLTEVDPSATPTVTTPAPTTAAPSAASSTSTSYPACSATATKQFTDNLSAASSGCMDSISYDWDGDTDPTPAQTTELCKCTVSPFSVPKCHWTKLGKYDVTTAEHFNFAYNCSGKTTPKVTEVDVSAASSTATTAAPTIPTSTAAPGTPDCTVQQLTAFTTALNIASSGCMGATSYNWGGNKDPNDSQYSEICKCAGVSAFTIPDCSIQKGEYKVTLAVHYNWVKSTQCPTFSPSKGSTSASSDTKSSSNIGMIAGIAGGVVVVALIIGCILVKRNRKANAKQEHYPPHDDMNAMNAMRSPSAYQPIGVTPGFNKTNTDPRVTHTTISTNDASARPSGVSNITHTNFSVSSGNGSARPSGSGSQRTTASTRYTETGQWDDPVIMALRIPHDAIFFGALLSRGGFGEVFRGTYKGETVAIKQLLPERRKDLKQIDDFLAEVKLMSTLEHERIVKFIGVAWNSLSDACVVVEFMDNGDLRSVLTRWDNGTERRMNGFDADKTRIAMHVAHALVYLHSLQPTVVHRDLKSKNILLDSNLDAKVTDFGTSRERADATMTAGVGSSLWMAPEVMMGARYDEKADIFSFGVVLSELDTHQLPYFHAKVTETGQKVPEAAIQQQVMLGRLSVGFTDRADPELVQLGRDCVKLDPKARPTAAQVLHRVHQVLRKF